MCANNSNDNLYPAIDAEMGRHGYSISTFSKKLGIERGTYYRWQEKGNIPATKLIEISKLFNCSVDYLLGINT